MPGMGFVPDFIRSSAKYGSMPGLERVTRLLSLLGNPQDAVPAVHVAGTNGKGSTAAMLASALSAAGYHTGLYTSPYILDVRESLAIGGAHVTASAYAAAAERLRGPVGRMEREGGPPTLFEIETALAFLWFRESGCDMAVVEAGMGGRLDATNVMKNPLLAVLTSISLDHTQYLGSTLCKIASEKCGILRRGGAAVCSPAQPAEALSAIRAAVAQKACALVIPDESAAEALSSSLGGTAVAYRGLRLRVPFAGLHQVRNAVTAVEALLALRERKGLTIPDEAIERGVARAALPLRQEVLCRRPVVLMDGAHNPGGAEALADTMRAYLGGRRTAVVMGMLADKDVRASVAAVAPLCGKFIAAAPRNARALPAAALAAVAAEHCGDVSVAEDYAAALHTAQGYAGENGAVVVCGSLYLAMPMRLLYTGVDSFR